MSDDLLTREEYAAIAADLIFPPPLLSTANSGLVKAVPFQP